MSKINCSYLWGFQLTFTYFQLLPFPRLIMIFMDLCSFYSVFQKHPLTNSREINDANGVALLVEFCVIYWFILFYQAGTGQYFGYSSLHLVDMTTDPPERVLTFNPPEQYRGQ